MFVRVKEHPDLRREGLTVHSDVSVSYLDAILGETPALSSQTPVWSQDLGVCQCHVSKPCRQYLLGMTRPLPRL